MARRAEDRAVKHDGGTRPVERPATWGIRTEAVERMFAWMVAWVVVATVPAIADEPRGPVAVAPSVIAQEDRRIEVSAKASQAAVAIFAGDAGGGSGVLISADGYALTNFHVVQPAGVAMKCGLSDGRLYDAVLVGLDPTGDVALVKLLGRDDFPFAELADSDAVRVGDACFTAGNPFLLATNFQPSIAWGIVSGVHRYQFPAGTILEYTDCLQVDAAINPGNSGGGLFDGEGRLIGVNGRASFEKRGRVNVGVGYAISSNQILNFLGSLKGGRIVDHATLGATVATSFDGKVVVSDIIESSDAYRRGLRYDDEIVAIADRPIRTVNAFKNVLGTLPAGWQVPLVARREGRRMEFVVRLAGVHSAVELAKIAGEQPAEPPDAGKDEPNDDESDEPKPKIRPRVGSANQRKPVQLPEAVARHYEKKLGFANHHFNRVERDRVGAAIATGGNPDAARGEWSLSGRLANGKRFAIRLSDRNGTIDLPTGTTSVDATGDLDAAPNPPGSGGMLAALLLWRRLLLEGPGTVGRTEYLGTHPIGTTPPPAEGANLPRRFADVLVSYVAGVQATFAVDGDTIRRIDLWVAPDADPCEIRLEGTFKPQGAAGAATWLPERLVVRHAEAEFGSFTLETVEFGAAGDRKDDAPAAAEPRAASNDAHPGGDGIVRRLIATTLAGLAAGQVGSEAGGAGDGRVASAGDVVAGAARRVVKVYGAGGFRGLEAYQSGLLVSPEGHVVTAMSTVLDSDQIDCVLDDGRRYTATLVGIDPRRELAVLSLDAEELPCFELPNESAEIRLTTAGSRVFALSNLFGVAAGDERVSVQHGVVSAVVPLEARRGSYEAVYDGDVYLLDFTVNNPGSPGGALVDVGGRLIGILGKELRSSASGTWLNYSLPVGEVAAAYRAILSGESGGLAPPPRDDSGPFDPIALGVVLVPDLFDKTPPFVETVVAGTAAERAGLRSDDLVIAIAGRSVTSRATLERALAAIREGDSVRLTLVRDGRVIEADLGPKPAIQPAKADAVPAPPDAVPAANGAAS